MANEITCVADVKNTLGEGPVWNAKAGKVFWVDITDRWLYSYDPENGETNRVRTPGQIGSYAFCDDSDEMIVGMEDGFHFFNPTTGESRKITDVEADVQGTRMNDGKADPAGRFWCGSIHEVSDPKDRRPIANVYRLDEKLEPQLIMDGIKTSNGFAWSPDAKTMYFTDTPTLTIRAFDYDVETGEATRGRVFAEIPQNAGRPDGAAVDMDGYLWSGHFAGSCVTRYAPDGSVDKVIEIPALNVTSVCFGGKDMKTLFITSAREDMTDAEMEALPLSGGLFVLETEVPGVPVGNFKTA